MEAETNNMNDTDAPPDEEVESLDGNITDPEVDDTDVDVEADDKEAVPAEGTAKPVFDKQRQQIQQEVGNAMRPLQDQITALLAVIQKQGGNATSAQLEEVKDLQGQVDQAGDVFSDLKKYAALKPEELDALDPNVLQNLLKGVLALHQGQASTAQQQVEQAKAQHAAQIIAWSKDYATKSGRDEATVKKMLSEHNAEMALRTLVLRGCGRRRCAKKGAIAHWPKQFAREHKSTKYLQLPSNARRLI